jgi:hypothetical protein
MDDLVDFLRARLKEREEALRALAEKTVADSYSALEMSLHAEISALARAQPQPQSMPAAEHAAWQHMLADVDAKRQIIETHTGTHECPFDPSLKQASVTVIDVLWNAEVPCLTLRLLALPHAGHPSYREEWRP